MDELNTRRSRSLVLYTSIIVVAIAGIGVVTAYQFAGPNTRPQEVVGDPGARIGNGKSASENPVTLPTLDQTTEQKKP